MWSKQASTASLPGKGKLFRVQAWCIGLRAYTLELQFRVHGLGFSRVYVFSIRIRQLCYVLLVAPTTSILRIAYSRTLNPKPY